MKEAIIQYNDTPSGGCMAISWKPLIRCKDCKHFEIKDHWADFGGVPILATSDCPTCNKWADGCMTKPDGYCFMAERRD